MSISPLVGFVLLVGATTMMEDPGAGQPAEAGAQATARPPRDRVLRGADDTVAISREQSVIQLRQAGRFREALAPAREVYELRMDRQGKDHWQTGDARRMLARLTKLSGLPQATQAEYLNTFQIESEAYDLMLRQLYPRAIQLERSVLDQRIAVLGDRDQDVVYTRLVLGHMSQVNGNDEEARKQLEAALDASRASLEHEHPMLYGGLSQLSHVLVRKNQVKRAEALDREAADIAVRLYADDSPEALQPQQNLGFDLESQGRVGEAAVVWRRLVAVVTKPGFRDTLRAVEIYQNFASNLHAQSRYAEAEPLLRQALVLARSDVNGDDEVIAQANMALASNLFEQRKFEAALALVQAASDVILASATADPEAKAGAHNALAAALARQPLNLEPIAEGIKPAELERRKKQRSIAEEVLARAFAEFKKSIELSSKPPMGRNSLECAVALTNMAAFLLAWREGANDRILSAPPDQPHTYLEAALAIVPANDEDKRQLAIARTVAAKCYISEGDFARAEGYARQALASVPATYPARDAARLQAGIGLGLCLYHQGHYEEAARYLSDAAEGYEIQRGLVSADGLDRAGFAADYSPMDRLAVLMVRLGKPQEAWKYLEATFARGLLDSFAWRNANPLTPEDAARERELRYGVNLAMSQVESLRKATRAPGSPRVAADKIKSMVARASTLEAEYTRLRADLQARSVAAASSPFELARVQRQIPPDTALVAWIDFDARLKSADLLGEHRACIVRHTGPPVWIDLTNHAGQRSWNRKNLDFALALSGALRDPGEPEWEPLAKKVYELWFAPLEPHLGARDGLPPVRRIVVLPSKVLSGVPIDALTNRLVVTHAPSATLFAWLGERAGVGPNTKAGDPRDRLLAICEPRTGLPSAPIARRQVSEIANLFRASGTGEPLVLTDESASERKLVEMAGDGTLSRFSDILFSVHGSDENPYPMQTTLILAGDPSPDQYLRRVLAGEVVYDGRLTAEKVRGWKLGARVVTLCACRSGLGPYLGGEGYLGFSQAFLLAGARSVVVTNWDASDPPATLLMRRFYQNLLGKRSGLEGPMRRDDALQEAKEWVRNLTLPEAENLLGGKLEAVLLGGKPVMAKPPRVGEEPIRPFRHPNRWAVFSFIGSPS